MHLMMTNVLETLRAQDYINPMTTRVLQDAFDCGCFVAGGFVDVYAKTIVNKCNFHSYSQSRINRHWFTDSNFSPEMKSAAISKIRGDIDVWAPDEEARRQFLQRVAKHDVLIQQSAGGWACNILCWSLDQTTVQKVQLITEITLTPAAVLDTFDIINAMCTIVNDKLFVHDRWLDLRSQRKISLNEKSCCKNNLLGRILKWFNLAHSYNDIHDDSIDCLDKMVNRVMSGDSFNDLTGVFKHYGYSEHVAMNLALNSYHRFYKYLRPETLLLMSAFYGAPPSGGDNNFPLTSLLSRGVVVGQM